MSQVRYNFTIIQKILLFSREVFSNESLCGSVILCSMGLFLFFWMKHGRIIHIYSCDRLTSVEQFSGQRTDSCTFLQGSECHSLDRTEGTNMRFTHPQPHASIIYSTAVLFEYLAFLYSVSGLFIQDHDLIFCQKIVSSNPIPVINQAKAQMVNLVNKMKCHVSLKSKEKFYIKCLNYHYFNNL